MQRLTHQLKLVVFVLLGRCRRGPLHVTMYNVQSAVGQNHHFGIKLPVSLFKLQHKSGSCKVDDISGSRWADQAAQFRSRTLANCLVRYHLKITFIVRLAVNRSGFGAPRSLEERPWSSPGAYKSPRDAWSRGVTPVHR